MRIFAAFLCTNIVVVIKKYFLKCFHTNDLGIKSETAIINNISLLTRDQREQFMIMRHRAVWSDAPKNIYQVNIDKLEMRSTWESKDTAIHVVYTWPEEKIFILFRQHQTT